MTGVKDHEDGVAGILWVWKPWLQVLKAVSVHVAAKQLGHHDVGSQTVTHNSYHMQATGLYGMDSFQHKVL